MPKINGPELESALTAKFGLDQKDTSLAVIFSVFMVTFPQDVHLEMIAQILGRIYPDEAYKPLIGKLLDAAYYCREVAIATAEREVLNATEN